MRVLLICDDHYHPGKVPIEGTAPLKQHGFEIEAVTDASKINPGFLKSFSVVILSKSDKVSLQDTTGWKHGEAQQALVDYVENGGGLIATHSGTVGGSESAPLDNLIGCRFKHHPKACPVFIQPLKPHPVTDGVGSFCETDEHYRVEILQPDIDVLAASYSPMQEEEKPEDDPFKKPGEWIGPACYVRSQGKGKICVLTPGHTPEVWLNPSFQKILENALNWCART